jgi:GPH family glycoside/pentoside/hexuronide:cation symporter
MPHITKESDKIPVAQKMAYGFGMSTPIAFVNSVANLTNLIYNIGLGVSPVLLGIAQMVPRLWDAISDPIAGNISDNTRSRWGRRRPYILVGGLLVAISFVLIWSVPVGLTEMGNFWYYLAMSLVFYTAVTIFSVPLVALGYEMSRDYHERTSLFAYGSFIGNIFAIMTPWMYHLSHLDVFQNEVEGMKAIGLGVAAIIALSAIVCFVFCKEKFVVQATKSQDQKVAFWPSMKATFRDKIYLKLIGVVFLVAAGFNFVNGFSNYIMIYYVFDGQKDQASYLMGINGTAWAISALIAVFPMTWCSKNYGKAKTVQFFVLLMVLGTLLKIVCYNRDYPWLTLIPTVFISTGMLVLFTMAGSMIADVCDLDELNNGVRREGSYSAVYSWWMKLAVSSAYLIAGILLESTGFDDKIIQQSENTLFMLRFWEIALPAALCLGGVFLLRNYPITEESAYETKRQLEANNEESVI